MTVLDPPRHHIVHAAMDLARTWCDGHLVGGAPALRHAMGVAVTLVRHRPDATAALVAATILHDAPQLAPADINVDDVIAPSVRALVRAFADEHDRADSGAPPGLENRDIVAAVAAHQIVAFGSLSRRAFAGWTPDRFGLPRGHLRERLPNYELWSNGAKALIPEPMHSDLVAAFTTLVFQARTIESVTA